MFGLKTKIQNRRIFKFRRRYVFTRGDRLRLRYVIAISLFVALVGGGVMQAGGLHGIKAVWVAEASQAPSYKEAPEAGGEDESFSIAGTLRDQISSSFMKAQQVLIKPKRPPYREIEVAKGGTIAGALQSAGVDNAQSYRIVKAISEHYDPRQVIAGQKIRLYYGQPVSVEGAVAPKLERLSMKLDVTREVVIDNAAASEVKAELITKDVERRTYARAAQIQTSLYGSALQAGIPSAIVAEVIHAYSWDVDFQRDIRRGDTLQVLYEVYETEDGDLARYGNVLSANLSVGGHPIPIYRFELSDGRIDYFEGSGHSIKKTLMKTPVDGARLSSGFGLRKHPILGYNKMHKGLDFAAPTGTPIYAAGDGIVEYSGRFSSYGNYVRIRHNSSLKTAYAHMHKINSRARKGKRVEQGEVIGYVGSTGRSTGPHLHYEVLVRGEQVNPRSVDLPVGEQLEGKDLKRFKALVAERNRQYKDQIGDTKLARRSGDDDSRIR